MKRFFAPDSFWNTPIAPDPAIDPESDEILNLVGRVTQSWGFANGNKGFWIASRKWTVPVYEVNADTPRKLVHQRPWGNPPAVVFRHGQCFENPIPFPDGAVPDPIGDSHMAVVDFTANKVWDMWAVHRRDDGQWESFTGMTYPADGPGVFDSRPFHLKDNDSVHFHGPGRASGVPLVAGLIMHHEVLAGRIEHKVAFATQANALKRFVSPTAIWTDGPEPGGVPEGATIQLDPGLDLARFDLSPAARTIARALQEYGAVCVEHCGGHTLYAEGLYGQHQDRSWDGLLSGPELFAIGLNHFRVLKIENAIEKGDPRFYPKARRYRENPSNRPAP